jgi:exopolysaccharide production protein ExoQ
VNPLLNFFERRFTIFALVFFSGTLACSSLYVDPDPKLDAGPVYNPISPLLSLVQYAIYITVFLLLLARWQSSVRTLLRDPLVWLLAGMALTSFIWSDFPSDSLRKGITTLQTTAFGLYMAARFSLREQLRLLLWALGLVAVFTLLFTIVFHGAAIEAGANAGAWRGPFVQKNILARILVLGALVFLVSALDRAKYRWLLWLGFMLCTGLLLLSGSKTGLLVLVVLILLLPLYRAMRWSGTLVIPLFITVILIAGSMATVVVGNWENLLLSLGRDPTLSGRTDLWEVALEMIGKRPWLGYGYQGFWQEGGGATVIWEVVRYKPPHCHNGFLNLALDLGLVGLFIFGLSILRNYQRSIAWVSQTKSFADLWPLLYTTFFFMYNHSENTIIEHNSLFWMLHVAVALSLRRLKSPYLEPSGGQSMLPMSSQV